MLLYECDEDIAEIIRGLPADQRGALCYVDPFILAQCLGKSTLAGWAVGGGVSNMISFKHYCILNFNMQTSYYSQIVLFTY